jgi:hypothetical protein
MATTSNTILTTMYQAVGAASLFVKATANNQANTKYLFVGEHVNSISPTPDVANSSLKYSSSDVYRHMTFGKRIDGNNVCQVIRNLAYIPNTSYDMYDDVVPDIWNTNFYTVTSAGSYHHIFKCLDNNLGSNSTIQPDFSDIVGSNTTLYQTADGYKWKYMCSFGQTANQMFASSSYVPVIANNVVMRSAVRGAIDVIKIKGVGRGYDNYLQGTFTSTDLRINGDSTIYQVTNSAATTVNGFYTGCGLYLSTGVGAGQYRKVVDYVSNANGNFLVIDTFFATNPTNGTQFEIYPSVVITGDGQQTINAVARALVNSYASNSIYRVEMINRGSNYNYASATVVANAVVGVISSAELRPIMSPRGGHGAHPLTELGASKVTIFVSLANTELDTIPASNQFRQIGIVEDPRFRYVLTTLTNRLGTFLSGEEVYSITPIRVADSVTISGANVSCNTASFLNAFTSNDHIYLLSNGISQYWGTVNVVTNTSFLTLTSNANFTATTAEAFIVAPLYVGTISSYDGSNTIEISDCVPIFRTGTKLIGASTSAVGSVISSSRQNVIKTSFSTFIQMHKYVGSQTFGTFIPNETLFQGSIDQSNSILYSATSNSGTLIVYASNQNGQFAVGSPIVGNTSSAIASIQYKYLPELIPNSGRVLYVENINPVQRQPNQTETFQLTLEF